MKIIQKAILGVSDLNITQGYNGSYSHKGTYALDLIGRNSGYIELRAPFDGVIKKVYKPTSNVVWLESLEPVKYANGLEDYMTVMTMHDDNVNDLYIGKIIKQGEIYYRGGTSGNTTGAHIHIEVGRGRFTNTGWYQNTYGKWIIYNHIRTHEALFLPTNCNIIYDYGYNWLQENIILNVNIVNLQKALNNSYNKNLISNTYDLETIQVIANNNLRYKKPTIKNDFVRWLQQNLVNLNYNINIDGSYGPKTRDAIKSFQRNYDLKVDGIVGNGVVSKLLELNK